jgi:hypothetical protein
MSESAEATGGPAEPAQRASSQTPDKDASATQTTGDGGGDRKGGKGKGSDGGGGGTGGVGKFFMGTGDGGAPPAVSYAAFLVVAAVFVGILASVFLPYILFSPKLDKTLLQQLADTETARGLITFLVAVSTVGIALILVVAMWSEKIDDYKDRFAFSKEILTSLIGILGTIIGFYFGATQDQTHHGTPTTLTLANLSITPPQPGKGDKVTLHATLSGGQSPYHYAIRFAPDTITKIEGDSPDGTVSHEIKFDAYDPAKPLDITFEGKDVTGLISSSRLHLAATQDQTHGQVTPTTPTLANLSVTPLTITPPNPKKGEMVTLHATLSGGQPPYSYTIRFTQDKIKEIKGKSANGTVIQEIKLGAYNPTTPLDITLEGKDDKGAIISSEPIHLGPAR